MRIAIDARELTGRPTGVGRYLSQVLAAWTTLPQAAEHEFVLCASEPLDLSPFAGLRTSTIAAAGAGTFWGQFTLPRLARKARADVLFAPAYEAPLRCPVPTVVSVHDVSFFAHPEWFRPRERVRRRVLTRASARQAARVLTFSEFSKREIVERLGVEPSRVLVTYHGVTAFDDAADDVVREPLVLYVGSLFNRRHVPELIDGFCRVSARHPDARLDIVGDNRTRPRVNFGPLAAPAGGGHIRMLSYLPERDLARLYRQARAFAFLSDYEGFGMTPLEALAAGVPILVLDTEVSREVYGEASLRIDSPEPAAIASALTRLLYDEGARTRILDAAGAVLRRYSWSRCGAQTLQALIDAAR